MKSKSDTKVPTLAIGLMSGTSTDGIDGALLSLKSHQGESLRGESPSGGIASGGIASGGIASGGIASENCHRSHRQPPLSRPGAGADQRDNRATNRTHRPPRPATHPTRQTLRRRGKPTQNKNPAATAWRSSAVTGKPSATARTENFRSRSNSATARLSRNSPASRW